MNDQAVRRAEDTASLDEPVRERNGRPVSAVAIAVAIVSSATAWSWLNPVYIPRSEGRWVGLLLLSVAVAACWFAFYRRRGPSKHVGVTLGFAVVVITGTADWLLVRYEASVQPVFGGFATFADALLTPIGLQAQETGGHLNILTGEGAFGVVPSMGLLALRPLLLSVVVSALLCCFAAGRRGAILTLLWTIVAALAIAVRFTWATVGFTRANGVLGESHHLGMTRYWDPWTVLVTLGLAALIWSAWVRFDTATPVRGERPSLRACAAGFGVFSLIGFSLFWTDPGTPKEGRVVIDERLSGVWEPAGRLLTTDRFGDFSTYSMAAMTEHLARRYSVRVNRTEAYTDEFLEGCDVLILKTPSGDLADTELDAIDRWVHAGGGLFAIGDHTDLEGISTRLNEVLDGYGVQFRFDFTEPNNSDPFDVWRSGLLAEHPISAGMAPFGLMTGCSLALSGGADPVVTLTQSSSRAGDYADRSHFGHLASRPEEFHGALVVAAANTVGSGRVVAFADSTVFSTFAYFIDSHSDFAVRSVAWLNRRGSFGAWIPQLALLVALLLAASRLRVLLGALRVPSGWLIAALGAVGGSALAAHGCAWGLRIPDASVDTPRVGFVVEGGHGWLPPVLGTQPELPPFGNFMTFMQVPIRLGLEVQEVPRRRAALEGIDLLVVINPDTESGQPEAPKDWVLAVREWVRRGGKLVVLQRREHRLCAHTRAHVYLDGVSLSDPVRLTESLELRRASEGAGAILHVLGSEAWSIEGLAHCMQHPSAGQRVNFEAAFQVFRGVADCDIENRKTYVP